MSVIGEGGSSGVGEGRGGEKEGEEDGGWWWEGE